MRAVHQMAQPNWQRMRQQETVSVIVGGLSEIPGADGTQMGWGVLGLSVLLNNVIDQIGPAIKARAFAEQATRGLQSGALIAGAVGCELISRGDLSGAEALRIPAELATRRPGVVASAATAIRESMASPAFAQDLLDNFRDEGRWAGQGIITQMIGELPGLHLPQAGTALLTCGGFLLNQGTQIGAKEMMRGLRRTRRKAAEGMTYVGTGLTGAIMAVSGDACLER